MGMNLHTSLLISSSFYLFFLLLTSLSKHSPLHLHLHFLLLSVAIHKAAVLNGSLFRAQHEISKHSMLLWVFIRLDGVKLTFSHILFVFFTILMKPGKTKSVDIHMSWLSTLRDIWCGTLNKWETVWAAIPAALDKSTSNVITCCFTAFQVGIVITQQFAPGIEILPISNFRGC